MKTPEARSPIEVLRDMSDHEILLGSIVILPGILGIWAFVLNATIPSGTWYWYLLRFVILLVAVPVAYYQCIVRLRTNETKLERLQRERKLLVARLKHRRNQTAGIEKMAAIDSEPTRELTTERIEALIAAFPGFFASCTVASKSPDHPGKPGVKLIADEE